MTQISVFQDIDSNVESVWLHLADLGSHVEWMRDAKAIEFTTGRRRGIGAVMEVETRVGPFRTLDLIEVTGWVEGQSIDVIHTGLIKGVGTLAVEPSGAGVRVSWIEDLLFPWWLGGPVTAWLARPVMKAIWRGNLARLAARAISP